MELQADPHSLSVRVAHVRKLRGFALEHVGLGGGGGQIRPCVLLDPKATRVRFLPGRGGGRPLQWGLEDSERWHFEDGGDRRRWGI